MDEKLLEWILRYECSYDGTRMYDVVLKSDLVEKIISLSNNSEYKYSNDNCFVLWILEYDCRYDGTFMDDVILKDDLMEKLKKTTLWISI